MATDSGPTTTFPQRGPSCCRRGSHGRTLDPSHWKQIRNGGEYCSERPVVVALSVCLELWRGTGFQRTASGNCDFPFVLLRDTIDVNLSYTNHPAIDKEDRWRMGNCEPVHFRGWLSEGQKRSMCHRIKETQSPTMVIAKTAIYAGVSLHLTMGRPILSACIFVTSLTIRR